MKHYENLEAGFKPNSKRKNEFSEYKKTAKKQRKSFNRKSKERYIEQ